MTGETTAVAMGVFSVFLKLFRESIGRCRNCVLARTGTCPGVSSTPRFHDTSDVCTRTGTRRRGLGVGVEVVVVAGFRLV